MTDTANPLAEILIRPINTADRGGWLHLRHALWPEGTLAEHHAEIEQFFSGQASIPLAVLAAIASNDRMIGFVELSIRNYAEGCHGNRIAYLEGWYVAPDYRHRGVGRALVGAAEDWGREQGCCEFASDTEVNNSLSHRAHQALGFEEAGIIRCYRKKLTPITK